MNADLSTIFADLLAEQHSHHSGLPPVEKWDPPLCGDMDLTIRRHGAWLHEGSEIKRKPLINLFSSVLKREDEEYFLVTPVEKWRITVEDAPFYVNDVELERRHGQQALVFQTTTGEHIVAGEGNPLWVDINPSSGEPSPYLMIRNNLKGLLSRAVFYQLAEWSRQRTVEGRLCSGVESLGQFFSLEG